jgi:hypothetical protein
MSEEVKSLMHFSTPASLSLAAALLISQPTASAGQADTPEINEAQRLVFMNDYLDDIGAGSVLSYGFSHRGRESKGFSDTVKVTVTDVLEGGKHNLSFDFLTGDNHIDFHPAAGYKGNPVAIQFLERDIQEMAKSTDGHAGYFQNRIRKSFVHPEIREVKIPYQGKEVDGVKISVTPFVNDPNIDRFKAYAGKRYEFLFSDQIPGGLYEIHTLVPGQDGGDPLVEEGLTFRQLTSVGTQ